MARTRKKVRKVADHRRVLFTRFTFVIALLVIWMGCIGVRLVHLQVNEHEYYLARAIDQRVDVKKSKLPRGSIFDRNGNILAMSVPVRTLYVDPAEIEDIPQAAKLIAKAVGHNEKSLARQIAEARESGKRYLPLVKKAEKELVDKLNKALYDPQAKKADEPRFAGLHWADEQKRSYPKGRLAAAVIGTANNEDQGVAGVERSQDAILRGATMKQFLNRDRTGRVFEETIVMPEEPKDVVLTIDSTIQYFVDEALANGVKAANAHSGMAIAIDPRTGAILAMSNYPTYDPNETPADGADLSNHAVQSVYTPGSVFKAITYAAALEKKLFRPEDMIDAGGGSIDVAGHVFRDSHHVGRVTYAEAMAHSSNVCAIKTSLRVGRTDFFAMLKKMGFGERTGIELPAETRGLVRSPERWNGDSQASMSIGYEIGVTALQMANAFATIANDGVRTKPHIIKEIRDADGSVVSATEPQQEQILSPEAAASLKVMLREVVLSGTGKRAQLDGYSSAGKTGTAWKFNSVTKRVDPGKYTSSFVGFAPYDDPRIVIAVVVDEPKTGARDGGGVAAPIFNQAAQNILREMGVAPDMAPKGDSMTAQEPLPEMPDVPDSDAAPAPDAEVPPTRRVGPKQKPSRSVEKLRAAGAAFKVPLRAGRARVGKFGQREIWVTRLRT
ncbi:MAG: peptidoglycan D,D-transpeptidase FtsI family protein [Pyrinomonadaceae bacterium]